jgi:ATP-binding cassette subfamily C protein CydC
MKPDQTVVPGALAVLRPFLGRMLAFRGWLALGLLLTWTSLLTSLGLLGLSGGFLTATAIAGLSPEAAHIFNFFYPSAGVRFFALSRTASRWAERVSTHEATFRLIGAMRVWLYQALCRLSPAQTGSLHGADLLSRLTRDIDALDNLYQRLLLPSIAAWLSLLLLAAVFAWQAPALLAPWGAFVAFALIAVPWLAWRIGGKLSPDLVAAQFELRRELLDAVDGIEDYALHAPAWQAQRQRVLQLDAVRVALQLRQQRRGAALRGLLLLSVGIVLWAVIGVLAALPSGAGPDGPWLAVILMLILASLEIVQNLPQAWLELPGTVASARRLQAIADMTPAPAYAERGPQPADAALQLDGLGFWHSPEHRLLDDVSLVIPPGTHLALLGPSGEGKSSLLDLLARLRDPREGAIRLGGVALPELDETTLRRHVACAPQEVWLFTASLADNLRLANPQADDAALWAVLDLVGLRETVAAWPDGLATWVDEQGASLSGGQRRRLGVARALLREAPVTLFDEATEGLDPAAEQALLARVRQHLRGRTLIWVSHRPTGLAEFDQVLLLEGGKLRPAGG